MTHTGVTSTSAYLDSSSSLLASAALLTKLAANVANAAVEYATDAAEVKKEKNLRTVKHLIQIDNDHVQQKYVNFSIFKTIMTNK